MQGKMKRGDRVLQLGVGSGFKACTIQWKALRNKNTQHPAWVPDKSRDTKLPNSAFEASEIALKVPISQALNIEMKAEE